MVLHAKMYISFKRFPTNIINTGKYIKVPRQVLFNFKCLLLTHGLKMWYNILDSLRFHLKLIQNTISDKGELEDWDSFENDVRSSLVKILA